MMVPFGWSLPVLLSPVAGLAAGLVAQRFIARYRSAFLVVPVTEAGLMSLSAAVEEGDASILGNTAPALRSTVFMVFAALVLAAWASVTLASGGAVWLSCILGWWLLTLAAIDIQLFILPDALTLGLALSGIAATAILAPDQTYDHILGAALGFGAFAAVRETYRRLRHREGLGLGDAKLMGALGAWLGWEPLPSVILIAAIGGLLGFAVTGLLRRSLKFNYPLPFGPFLALGAWVVWLYGGVALG